MKTKLSWSGRFSLARLATATAFTLIELLVGITNLSAQPTITKQPVDQSVSLGANVTNQVTAAGAAPLAYQWRFNDAPLTPGTNRSLVLTNIQLAQAGKYAVVVSDASGSSVTSRMAVIDVDPAFTKITTGPIATDRVST